MKEDKKCMCLLYMLPRVRTMMNVTNHKCDCAWPQIEFVSSINILSCYLYVSMYYMRHYNVNQYTTRRTSRVYLMDRIHVVPKYVLLINRHVIMLVLFPLVPSQSIIDVAKILSHVTRQM
jgi:hypothetical protein